MRRVLLLATAAALLAAAPAAAVLPIHLSGSSIGEGVPLKAYAAMSPSVHLFGDLVTAKLAVVADTKWVDPARLRVRTAFAPYTIVRTPQVLRLRAGRFTQVTWTWRIRCLASPCVPRTPPSDKFHVFRFPPAHVDYMTPQGKRLYGIDAYWPRIEVLSQVSPGVQRFLELTKKIDWQVHLTPVAAPTYRVPPTLLFWLTVALAGAAGGLGLAIAGRWALRVRPRVAAAAALPGTTLERALAVLRHAHETGDETLQRKAFERVADELGVERAGELARTARELAWSPRTPEDAEVEAFAVQALSQEEDGA
jgi:hypothetical protein